MLAIAIEFLERKKYFLGDIVPQIIQDPNMPHLHQNKNLWSFQMLPQQLLKRQNHPDHLIYPHQHSKNLLRRQKQQQKLLLNFLEVLYPSVMNNFVIFLNLLGLD